MTTYYYKDALKNAMHDAMEKNNHVVVMGQGVGDPTGIFGTTKGLIEKFGKERVIDTPIAEESMTGMALGMALNGIYPIQTHIRVDFLLLAMNQIINLIAKYKYMYGGDFEVPMLIRAVIGRSWGQGPQHSQSLQSLFSHIPGLTVLMPSSAEDAYNSYVYAVEKYKGPVLSIEHRFLYDLSFNKIDDEERALQPFSSRIVEKGNDITIIATSFMVQEAQQAAKWVKENQGISCEIIDPHIMTDVDHELIFNSVKKTGHLVVADTDWLAYGFCSEVARAILEKDITVLKKPMKSLGMAAVPCPTSHSLEDLYYPDMSNIVSAINELLINEKHDIEMPDKQYAKKTWNTFKGPF